MTRGGAPVPLTPKEYDLLLLLLRNRGHVLYRTYLYETVWGEEEFGQSTARWTPTSSGCAESWGGRRDPHHPPGGYCLAAE